MWNQIPGNGYTKGQVEMVPGSGNVALMTNLVVTCTFSTKLVPVLVQL